MTRGVVARWSPLWRGVLLLLALSSLLAGVVEGREQPSRRAVDLAELPSVVDQEDSEEGGVGPADSLGDPADSDVASDVMDSEEGLGNALFGGDDLDGDVDDEGTYGDSEVEEETPPAVPRQIVTSGDRCLAGHGYFLRVEACDAAKSTQLFELTEEGFLRRPHDGLCVDELGAPRNWNSLRHKACKGTDAQRFRMTAEGRIINEGSGRCAIVASERLVKVYDCAGSRDTAIWQFGGPTSDDVPVRSFTPLDAVQIRGVGSGSNSGKCVEAKGYYARERACEDNNGQRLSYTSQGMIIRNSDGRCLDVSGAARNWASLRFVLCRGLVQQKFTLLSNGHLVSNRSGRCLVVASAARIKMYDCNDANLVVKWEFAALN